MAIIRPDNLPSQGSPRNLGMQLEPTAHVHDGNARAVGLQLGPS